MNLPKQAIRKIQPRRIPLRAGSENRVAAIIAAYRRLLVEDYRRITTRNVAKEAGIPVSSVYQYFPNKESLAFVVYRQWAEEENGIQRKRRQDIATKIRWPEYFEIYKKDFTGYIRDAKLIYRLNLAMESSPELSKVQRSYLSEMTGIMVDIFQGLGSNWPRQAVKSYVLLLFEINLIMLRYVARQSGTGYEEMYGNWEFIVHSMLKRLIETPYEFVKKTPLPLP